MSDNGNVIGAVADEMVDLGKGIANQITGAPSAAVKTAFTQTTGVTKTPEELAREQEEQAFRLRRSQEIEAEMKEIALRMDQRTGPEIAQETTTTNDEQNFTPSEAQTANTIAKPSTRETGRDGVKE